MNETRRLDGAICSLGLVQENLEGLLACAKGAEDGASRVEGIQPLSRSIVYAAALQSVTTSLRCLRGIRDGIGPGHPDFKAL